MKPSSASPVAPTSLFHSLNSAELEPRAPSDLRSLLWPQDGENTTIPDAANFSSKRAWLAALLQQALDSVEDLEVEDDDEPLVLLGGPERS
eukprot:CAMPEP_0172471220 /NCGR_PEP_ID=MMETSP1065-20121228/67708_1 /TAXON_ID=265537 /ORGANISM="Amphiprora paludosa, Strain CCMP125" /LENGTH=90 /DNA_ID=CAMNT_0013229315 /DNA_START=68 /DNA_END=340 /DNA_ORIENTATION=+